MTEQHEAILERLMRLDPRTCMRMRPTHQRPNRWYVDIGSVAVSLLSSSAWAGFFENGSTPEEALERTWAAIIGRSAESSLFFLKYHCPSNVPIPGDDPQVWVRWSEERDDWVDVEPTATALQVRNIPADRIHPYARSVETIQHR